MQINSEQLSGPDGVIATTFEYDGIQRLVKVTDAEGNTTTSVYDMGDRRTEVVHPASGKTTFTYDALGNVLTKQTAELAKGDKVITYDYDYHRLAGISYPDHPENNVRYYYGGRNASHNRKGRLELIEDGTGATEYYYGRMGEVTKTRRTLIVPNQAIATYVTQWSYDSQNRLLEMIYPDEERVTYSYDNGGQLVKVSGYKSFGYDYVSSIGYDKFGQRTYLKYGNGTETTYTYDRLRTRLENLNVSAGGNAIMDNTYTYDAVGNVLGVSNGAKLPEKGVLGGNMQHRYEYDALYRLTSATGTYMGSEGKSASYTLNMTYDNMYRVTGKSQHLSQTGVQFDGTLSAGYDLTYAYSGEAGKRFQLAGVDDVNYSAETVTEESKVVNAHTYEYDANGNLVFVNTSRTKKDGQTTPNAGERKLKWDEENRLTASDDNGFVTSYWYDASGERTVKSSGENAAMFVNAEFAGGTTNTAKFSLYVSPYLVANQGGRYTKHVYIGSQRIVSKLGDLKSYGADPRRIEYAGSESDGPKVDYKTKYAQQQQVIKDNFALFDVPYNGTDNNDYVDGKGFSERDGSLKSAMLKAASLKDNFQQGDSYEQYQYFYHSDHLGSSSFITNTEGEVVQHIEYVPYGEVFIEERNNVWNTPYLFNAKEFDEETGLYYYGARYYDARLAMWYGVDALAEKYPNMSPYNYCVGNPVKFVDPDGERVYLVYYQNTENFNVIADTRRREIETSDDFDSSKDHVYMASFDDVSEIINMTSDFISNSKECGYGKTVELSIYSHCGSDGPIGNVNTTQFSLGEDTGSHFDDNQMTINGWSSIDFNFDNHSIAAFYGCQSAFFAQKFISKIGNKPAYSAGFGGRAGDSKSMDVFSPNRFSIFDKVGDNLYMMDGMGLVVYDKNARETNVSFQIQTNIQINTKGAISGPTRTGRKSWSTNDIKGYND